jgi:hypothetical protein
MDDRWSAQDMGHLEQWEGEFDQQQEWPVYWNMWDTWLRRMLFAGAGLVVWTVFFGLIVIAIKGDI